MALLSLWNGIHNNVQETYIRCSFTKAVNERASHLISISSLAGGIIGCIIPYYMFSGPFLLLQEFNAKFLTVKDHVSKDEDSPGYHYHDIIANFQMAVGTGLVILCLFAILITIFRFSEITDYEREQFSICQMQQRREKSEQLLQEQLKTFCLVSQEEVELLRCQRPHFPTLLSTLLQKYSFDLVYGIFLATACLNLYATFDFLTFSETLANYQQQVDELGSKDTKILKEFSFALVSNAKLSLILFGVCQLMYLASSFIFSLLTKFEILGQVNLSNLTTISLVTLILGILNLALGTEHFDSTKKQPQSIQLFRIIVSQIMIAFSISMGLLSTEARIQQLIGSPNLI